MSNIINLIPSNELSMADKAADALGNAAAWTADTIQGAVTEAGFMAIAGYARAEDIIVTLKDNRQAVYEQARLESKARMTARLARRGIIVS